MRPIAVATCRSACETRSRRIPKRAYVIRLMSRHRPSLASLGRYVPYTTRDSQFAQCLIRCWRARQPDSAIISSDRHHLAVSVRRELARLRAASRPRLQRSSCPRCWWRLRCRRRPVGRSQITDGALRQTSSDRTSPPGGGPAVFVQRPFLDRMPRPSDGCNATTCLV
jgi:hypothetical protein